MDSSIFKARLMPHKHIVGLVLVAVVFCVLRFAFFYSVYDQDNSLIIDPDTLSYRHISLSIFERGKYERVEGTPESHRPPAYPTYLAINYLAFGKNNLLAPVIGQHVMFFIVSIIVGYLAYQLAGFLAAVTSFVLISTDFTLFYYFNEIVNYSSDGTTYCEHSTEKL